MEINYKSFRDLQWTDKQLLSYKNLLCQLSNTIDTNITADQMRTKLMSIASNHSYEIYIAWDKDDIVWTCTLLLEETFLHNCGINGHVENLVVDHKYRGQNIASTLLQMIKEKAHAQWAYKIILDCDTKLSPLYEKQWFICKWLYMAMYF